MQYLKCICIWTILASLWTFLGVRVSQDYEVRTDFSKFRSFDWAPLPQKKTGDARLDNALMGKRIRNAVEHTLIQNGYPKASEGKPDFHVAYHWSVKTMLESDTIITESRWGGYPFWGGAGYETYIHEYYEGTLIIDFFDADTNKLLWRGAGFRRVTQYSDPQKTTEAINKTVDEILKQYPPKVRSFNRVRSGCSAQPGKVASAARQT